MSRFAFEPPRASFKQLMAGQYSKVPAPALAPLSTSSYSNCVRASASAARNGFVFEPRPLALVPRATGSVIELRPRKR